MADEAVLGLDHIPVAVSDLERSEANFAALGFVLKPGRPHANGLRNAHVKFPDGTEIELITAPTPTDALASQYHAWAKSGDGPVFLGLYAPDIGLLTNRLSRLGLALEQLGGLATIAGPSAPPRVFFARRQRSPTDRSAHFSHPNTAFRLGAVWLAGAEAEHDLLRKLGASPGSQQTCGPFAAGASALSLAEAEIMFLPATAALTPGRPIVGVTVMVESLETARRVLIRNRISFQELAGCARRSLWIAPAAVHGMWLELLQAPPLPARRG